MTVARTARPAHRQSRRQHRAGSDSGLVPEAFLGRVPRTLEDALEEALSAIATEAPRARCLVCDAASVGSDGGCRSCGSSLS